MTELELEKIGTVYRDPKNKNLIFVESTADGGDGRKNENLDNITINTNNTGEVRINYNGNWKVPVPKNEESK